MVIYPVPAAVTQAKIQLVIDETAKAPSHQINADVQDLVQAQAHAERGLARPQGLTERPAAIVIAVSAGGSRIFSVYAILAI